MTALTKAYLAEMSAGQSPTEVSGTRVDVQFNPSSLRMQLSNKTSGGQQSGAQGRQRAGSGEIQLSFDLVFDTADEGDTDRAVSVLDKTKAVERFVRPRGNRSGQEAPPRVLFAWGDFQVQGTMDSTNIDLDLFSAQGVPLRAKVSVTIKGQDPGMTYVPAQPPPGGPASGASAQRPGTRLPPGAPGTQGSGLSPDKLVQALPGESLAQLAARNGLDPGLWRALADGIGNPLTLTLGQEVPLPPAASRQTASGSVGQGLDPAAATAALPLAGAPIVGNGGGTGAAPDAVRQGQAVAQRGGLQGAIRQIQSDSHQAIAGQALAGFGLNATATADTDNRPWGQGVPLRPRFGSAVAAAGPLAPAGAIGRNAPQSATAIPLRRRAGGCGCGGRCGCQ